MKLFKKIKNKPHPSSEDELVRFTHMRDALIDKRNELTDEEIGILLTDNEIDNFLNGLSRREIVILLQMITIHTINFNRGN